MISVVIPTRNRATVLQRVLPSYCCQKDVSEIVIVDDCSTDNTRQVVSECAERYTRSKVCYIKHDVRLGAAASRNDGVVAATCDYILFGEDDAFLEVDYATTLMHKLQDPSEPVEIASGRLIYMLPSEQPDQARRRFGQGTNLQDPFDISQFKANVDAMFHEDVLLPLTHALILTRRSLLQRFPYDVSYSGGNSLREESVFQVKAFLGGCRILVTNDTHCMHLAYSDVPSGGQRIGPFSSLYWNIKHTKTFYDDYYPGLQASLGLKRPKHIALMVYVWRQVAELAVACRTGLLKRILWLICRMRSPRKIS